MRSLKRVERTALNLKSKNKLWKKSEKWEEYLRGKSSELSSRTDTDVLWEVSFSSLMENDGALEFHSTYLKKIVATLKPKDS